MSAKERVLQIADELINAIFTPQALRMLEAFSAYADVVASSTGTDMEEVHRAVMAIMGRYPSPLVFVAYAAALSALVESMPEVVQVAFLGKTIKVPDDVLLKAMLELEGGSR